LEARYCRLQKLEKPIKKVVMIISGIIITSLLATLVYLALFSKPPTIPTPVATPKPVTATIKLRGEELGALKYGTDYFVDVSGRNYLITVLSAPKRLIYNVRRFIEVKISKMQF
jgi:hypothetical protein